MRLLSKITGIGLVAVFAIACGTKEQPVTHQQETGEAHEETGHSEEQSIATLTAEQMKAIDLQIAPVESKELTATIRANGVLRVPNNNQGNATSLYGGVVRKINVQIGDNVRKGQVVATIAHPQFIEMQEEYLAVNSKIVFAEQEQERQQELSDGNAGARKNLQAATAQLNGLRTRKAALQRQLQMMGISPERLSDKTMRSELTVLSPVSGTVSNVFAKVGSYVDVSAPVVEIVDNSSLHLDLQVFEKDMPKLKVGQVIHFTITNNPAQEYDAKVFSIGSSFENDSKTIAVHCNVTGNKSGLIDGMNVTGLVSLSNVTTPAVPTDAIVEADGKFYVFVKTDKAPAHEKEGTHEHGTEEAAHANEEPHEHNAGEMHAPEKEAQSSFNFEKIEVVKGVTDLGYTAITFLKEVPAHAMVVVKGAFFVNAKLSNTGGHEH